MHSIADRSERLAPSTTTPPTSGRHRVVVSILCFVATAAGFYFGTGLHPIPWLVWLAPLPCLVLAPRVSSRAAVTLAGAAFLVGELSMLGYVLDLEVPIGLVLGVYLLLAAVFAAAVDLVRVLTLAGRPALAAVAAGSCWAGADYVVSQVSPHGAFSSLAYTQADVLPVLQIASATGIWGISYLLIWLPAAIAGLVAPRQRTGVGCVEQSCCSWSREWCSATAGGVSPTHTAPDHVRSSHLLPSTRTRTSWSRTALRAGR